MNLEGSNGHVAIKALREDLWAGIALLTFGRARIVTWRSPDWWFYVDGW